MTTRTGFRLTIKIGNAAMSSGSDVAGALYRIANDLKQRQASGRAGRVQGGAVLDRNGNIVGMWTLCLPAKGKGD